MKTLIIPIACITGLVAGIAYAQSCILVAPASPPTPDRLIVFLPVDGGTTGCEVSAQGSSVAPPSRYSVSNAKCAQAVGMAKQAYAIDNGWADGGVP